MSTSPTTAKPVPGKPPRFGLRHALALVFAVGVTVGVLAFSDQIAQFKELGYLGIFLTMLATSATLILPAPGLLFVFVLGKTLNPLLLGLVAGTGSSLGEITGYVAGYGGNGVVENIDAYRRVEGWVKKYSVIPIFVLALIPNPLFDVAGLASGVLGIQWWKFLAATLAGKVLKCVIVAYAGFYGMAWIEGLLGQ